MLKKKWQMKQKDAYRFEHRAAAFAPAPSPPLLLPETKQKIKAQDKNSKSAAVNKLKRKVPSALAAP